MTELELKDSFAKAYRIIRDERAMREAVFHEGHPKRAKKLKEMDDLLGVLTLFKDEIKGFMGLDAEPEPEQGRLLDVPQKGAYG